MTQSSFRTFRHRAALALLTLAAAVAPLRAEAPSAQKYLRFADDAGKPQLQTSIVHFENADGVRVDLIGAVHIADRAYFASLNKRFADYDAVLYEMVKPKDMEGVQLNGHSSSWVSILQRFMQEQLDLEFQLDRIDYGAANFVHADLDAETFAERQAARGESMVTLMMNTMMRELNKPVDETAADNVMGIMDLIEALQSPDRSRQLKLVLARQFEHMDDALDAMGGSDGSVILDERNKHALAVLKDQIDAGDKKHFAIFYGAAHLKGMESMMVDLMGFHQVGEPEWLVAWDMSPAAAAREPAEEPTTRAMVRRRPAGSPTTLPTTVPAH